MSDQLHVEVRVRGRLGGDLLALVGDLHPRSVPRHTVLTVGSHSGGDGDGGGAGPGAGDLARLLTALHRAGIELERVLPCAPIGTGGLPGGAGDG